MSKPRRGTRAAGRVLLWAALYAGAWFLILAWLQGPIWLMPLLYPVVCPAMYYALSPVAQPLGIWRYLSRYLIAYRAWPRAPLTLHLGTSYDVLWRLLPTVQPGESRVRALHREIYRGLGALCREIREGRVAAKTEVHACSYFLSDRRMTDLGFRKGPAPLLTRLNFLLAYPEVLLQQWLISGKLQFFNPNRVRFFRTTAGELAQRAERLQLPE